MGWCRLVPTRPKRIGSGSADRTGRAGTRRRDQGQQRDARAGLEPQADEVRGHAPRLVHHLAPGVVDDPAAADGLREASVTIVAISSATVRSSGTRRLSA